MGSVMGKRPDNSRGRRRRGRWQQPQRHSFSEFSLVDMAANLSHRFSVLSGLSFISFISTQSSESGCKPWSRVSRKRWHQSTLENEYACSKTVWPVAQTEALFLPEFPIGAEEKLKLVLLGEISRGAFGQVFHVRCANTNKEYAMKVLSKSQVCSLDAVEQVKQEVLIQHVCSHHPFVTPLTHFWQTRKLLLVMTEYVAFGELQQLWRSLGRLPENLVQLYVAQIALALDFLHNAGIIYRDLKLENILLDADGHVKLIDFGMAKWLHYGSRTSTICGTLQYMAPEVLKGSEYTHSADWWSLGIITYCLMAGQYPLSGYDDHVTMSSAVEKFEFTAPECASPAMKELITRMLTKEPALRLRSFHQLQRETMFHTYDFEEVREMKVSPRKLLEDFIEGKTKQSFEDFAGLTSTPKKTLQTPAPPEEALASSSPQLSARQASSSQLLPSTSSQFIVKGNQLSASSPLLHPGRLGHHDSLVKTLHSNRTNGAAVPLLQSPLLRLARKQVVAPPRRSFSQVQISASRVPTAVSPLMVNVKGQRRKQLAQPKKDTSKQFASADTNTVISGMNGVYKKCVSEEVVDGKKDEATADILPRSQTVDDKKVCVGSGSCAKESLKDNNGCSDLDEQFFQDLVTSTPKKSTSAFNNSGNLRHSYHQAVSADNVARFPIINGALLGSNNFRPLLEDDFDEDSFDNFPWISESIDL